MPFGAETGKGTEACKLEFMLMAGVGDLGTTVVTQSAAMPKCPLQ